MAATAATGALLLFGAVQATMITQELRQGERFQRWQLLGFLLAAGGLIGLLLLMTTNIEPLRDNANGATP